ncbi:MAG: hypothetical protein Q7K21_04195 [Elusimicrobiota bacterium]|nr:hypothetical protein [Elusimicrobiota bacterium]
MINRFIFWAVCLILLYEFRSDIIKFLKGLFPSLSKSKTINIREYIDWQKFIWGIVIFFIIWYAFKKVESSDLFWFLSKGITYKIFECLIYFFGISCLFSIVGKENLQRTLVINKFKRLIRWAIFLYFMVGIYPYFEIIFNRVKISIREPQKKQIQNTDMQKMQEVQYPVLEKIEEMNK